MTNRIIWRLILLGALSIIGILVFQAWWFMQTWKFKDQEFQQKAHIALINVAREIAKFNNSELPSYDLVKKLSSNYYVVNINDAIDAGALEYYLRKEFEALSMTMDFEYAIYDCASDQMVYGDYYSLTNDKVAPPLATDLPKYDQFLYYFGVRFPGKTTFILEKMPTALVITGILLITILFFLYAMYIILRQKRLSELQKDFINNMTHEFKTPISTIRISSEVLQKDPYILKNDRLTRYTKIISEQNNRLNEQVEKVLQLAQIERGSFKINPKPLDLHEVILNLLPSLQVKVQEEEGTLETALDAVRTRIDADPLHLQNVIQNLIDNGVKYCRENPQISLSTSNEGKHILLTIRDEGIGIPKDLQGQVFSKFYRIPTGNVHNVKGFGLGLYYVKSVCDSHQWEIKLDSEPQSFSSFTIKIPLL